MNKRTMSLAIVAITPGGAHLARKLGPMLAGAEVYLPDRLRKDDNCNYFSGRLSSLLPELFVQAEQLACIMATGIVVRILAPYLRGKDKDAAVVVMDEAGQYSISLLSGHLGGANYLAQRLAEISGGKAVITTATDVNHLPAWDVVARERKLAVEPLVHLRLLNRLILEGEKIALVDPDRHIADAFTLVPGVEVYDSFAVAFKTRPKGLVYVTDRYLPHINRQKELLAIRPKHLVLGIGCNRGTSAAEIEAAVREELKKAFLAFASIGRVATIEAKVDESGITEFADKYGLRIDYHAADLLNRVKVPSPPSKHAMKAVGAKGVCEPAALISASGGPLLVRKQVRGNLTLAVARRNN